MIQRSAFICSFLSLFSCKNFALFHFFHLQNFFPKDAYGQNTGPGNSSVADVSPCPESSQAIVDNLGRPRKCLPRNVELCGATNACCFHNQVDYYCCSGVAECPNYSNSTVIIYRSPNSYDQVPYASIFADRPRSNIPNFDQYPGIRGSAPTYGGGGSSASLVPAQPYVVQPATQQSFYYPAPAPAPAPIPSYGAAAPAYGAPGPSAPVPSPGCAMGNCAGVVSQVSPQPGQAAVAVQPPPGYSGTPGQTQYIYKPAPAPVKGGCKWCKEITPPPAYPPAPPPQAGGYGAPVKPTNHLLCPTCTMNAAPGMPFIAVQMSGPQVDSHMQFVMPQPNVPCATCAGGTTGPAQPSQAYGNVAPPQPLPSYGQSPPANTYISAPAPAAPVVAPATAYGQSAPAPAASSYASGSAGVAANVYPVGTVPPSVIGGQPNVIPTGIGPSNVAVGGTAAGGQLASSAPFPQPGDFTLPTGSATGPAVKIAPPANRSRILSESNDEDPETVGILNVDKEEGLKKLRLKDPFSSIIRRRLKDTVPLAVDADDPMSNNGVALTLNADVNSYGREPAPSRNVPNYRLHGGETVH